MKNCNLHYVTLLTLFIFNFNSFAQDAPWCATDLISVETDSQNRVPGDTALYAPKLYNMTFWVVYRSDGSSDYAVIEKDCLEVIANMNREFNRFNIFFKYRGVNYLYDDDAYYVERTCDEDGDGEIEGLGVISSLASQQGNFDPNSLNTYVFYDGCGFSGFYAGGRNAYVRSERFNDYHTVHELGHMFGLAHTWNGVEEYDPEDPYQTCEHVTRDENDPEYNADVAGDDVTDTAAMPRFSKVPGNINYVDPNTCTYEGDGKDCQNNDFQIPPNSKGTLNFMNDGSECPTTSYSSANDDEGFTEQQGFKMRLKIDNFPNRFGPAEEATFEALYEPYKGEYYSVGPSVSIKPHFQPGFTYHFVECDGNYSQPAPFNQDFYINTRNILLKIDKYIEPRFYNTIVHPNHSAIIIKEVDEAFQFSKAQKCYDNNNRSPTGGSVMKFNDNVFNTNITVTPKDSTQINNPDLIPALPSGLYKIDKTYEDGSNDETVIFKENK